MRVRNRRGPPCVAWHATLPLPLGEVHHVDVVSQQAHETPTVGLHEASVERTGRRHDSWEVVVSQIS